MSTPPSLPPTRDRLAAMAQQLAARRLPASASPVTDTACATVSIPSGHEGELSPLMDSSTGGFVFTFPGGLLGNSHAGTHTEDIAGVGSDIHQAFRRSNEDGSSTSTDLEATSRLGDSASEVEGDSSSWITMPELEEMHLDTDSIPEPDAYEQMLSYFGLDDPNINGSYEGSVSSQNHSSTTDSWDSEEASVTLPERMPLRRNLPGRSTYPPTGPPGGLHVNEEQLDFILDRQEDDGYVDIRGYDNNRLFGLRESPAHYILALRHLHAAEAGRYDGEESRSTTTVTTRASTTMAHQTWTEGSIRLPHHPIPTHPATAIPRGGHGR